MPRLNQHMTHLEDLVLLGKDGLDELTDKIEKFIGSIENNMNSILASVKIDGAPAVVVWSKFKDYPDNSICLKSFLTSNKNCLSSVVDIEEKYGNRPDMAEKLKYCLELSRSIPSGQAWQGDCLYSKSDLKESEINGTKYITFHPNKIVYAFSEENAPYEDIKKSNFGICFHTIYTGDLEHKTQSFNVDSRRLTNIPDGIFVMSPVLNYSKNPDDYNLAEIKEKFSKLKELKTSLLSDPVYKELVENNSFISFWNRFENNAIADKKSVTINKSTFITDLLDFIQEKLKAELDKKIASAKTERGVQSAKNRYDSSIFELDNLIMNSKDTLNQIVDSINTAAEIKMLMLGGYKKSVLDYNTFYKHKEQGYIPTDMEGVALSTQDGEVVKLVDRTTFSNANRDQNYLSGFIHESLISEDFTSFSSYDD